MPTDYWKRPTPELRKSLESHEAAIAEHEYKKAHIEQFAKPEVLANPRHKAGLLFFWEKEIRNLRTQIQMIRTELDRRERQ